MGLPDAQQQDGLADLRAELDGIDVQLLDTLKQRLQICARIAVYKKTHTIPMMQPHRIGLVQKRAADFAKDHGINPIFLRQLYELIIQETCSLEENIISGNEQAADVVTLNSAKT